MGKSSRVRGESHKRAPSAVLMSIVEVEASVNADIEKARVASREQLNVAQQSIPDLVSDIERQAQEDARARERAIQQSSQERIEDIKRQGLKEADQLRIKLQENFDRTVDYIVERVTQTRA